MSIDPQLYFSSDDSYAPIQCVMINGQPVEPSTGLTKPPPSSQSNWRIRGTSTDLYIDRSDTQSFAGSSKATISFANNGTAKSQTTQFTGDVGYNIPTNFLSGHSGDSIEIIPYAGINRDVVTVSNGSTVKPSTTDTADFGVIGSTYLIINSSPLAFGNQLNLRPDYLFNFHDGSRILTFNIQYIPVMNNRVNSYFPIIHGSDNFASAELMLDFRSDNGTYTDRGTSNIAAHTNFARIGGQAGVGVISDNDSVPVSFSATYTGLYDASGPINVGEFIASLTYYLDPNKYLGLSASYANGTREDTAQREQKWDIALTAHF
jgi:hypothetical protein